tara:strand:+ start:337 stop:729 length:393 start_codon:yes stop_codon:yes gene_type:complete
MGLSVGFDTIFDRFFNMDVGSQQSYPPYNIRKQSEFQYTIELALAGFSKDDIEVELTDGQLVVRSKDNDKDEDSDSFVHKGIARRSFTRSFSLADDVIVKGADLKDGMLIIDLERVIPEEKKPRLIQIGS